MSILKETDPRASEMIKSIVEKYLMPPEQFLYGFADLNRVLDPQFGDFRFGISIGQQLDHKIVNSIKSGPTPAYYDHYKTTNEELSVLSQNIAQELNRNGVETLCVEPTISTDKLDSEYYLTLRSQLSHKIVATRAGLGWIGKTALFISKEFGPRLRLVTILTNTPLVISSVPVNKSRCGKCGICVEACPAEAASGQLWDTTLDRDQFFDAQKCRAMCKEFGERILGADARICGICVSVCPIENNNMN